MQTGIGALLFGLMLLLAAGIVSIVGAGVREGQLEPGVDPPPSRVRCARITMAVTAAGVAALVILGNQWWNSEASNYSRIIYKPLELAPSLEPGGRLILRLNDPGWLRRRVDDLIPDHTHLMHMYVIRLPEMEQVWHLHPEQIEAGVFAQDLPDMPAGRYQLFADIVHQSGIPETLTAEMDLPQVTGKPLSGDDSYGAGPPIGKATATAQLPDGGKMIWENSGAPLHARQVTEFRFRIEPGGRHAALHGHARTRRFRENRPHRFRARASLRIGPDGRVVAHQFRSARGTRHGLGIAAGSHVPVRSTAGRQLSHLCSNKE